MIGKIAIDSDYDHIYLVNEKALSRVSFFVLPWNSSNVDVSKNDWDSSTLTFHYPELLDLAIIISSWHWL